MTTDRDLIDALKETVEVQKRLIKLLESEVEILRLAKLFIGAPSKNPPPLAPSFPNFPQNPMPFIPGPDPLPYTVTCDGAKTFPVAPTTLETLMGSLKESLR